MKYRKGSSGFHAFDRRSGVNLLMDEIDIAPDQWSDAPRHVAIALTNACDLSCSHCYAPKTRGRLNKGTIQQWLLELDQNGCLGIGFGGGEPTLYPSLIELCEFAQRETEMALTITTHGHLLKGSYADRLIRSLNFIRFSMDGTESVYERIRGRSFDDFLKIVREVSKSKAFGINYVVNRKTIDGLDKASRIVEDLGASDLLLLPEIGFGKGQAVPETVTASLVEWVRNYDGPLKLAISENHANDVESVSPFGDENGLNSYLHIDALGMLKKTSFDETGIEITDGIMNAIRKIKQTEEL